MLAELNWCHLHTASCPEIKVIDFKFIHIGGGRFRILGGGGGGARGGGKFAAGTCRRNDLDAT